MNEIGKDKKMIKDKIKTIHNTLAHQCLPGAFSYAITYDCK